MGFLSNLFSGREKDAVEETLEEGMEKGAENFPDLYSGCSLDISDSAGAELFTGRLTAFTFQELSIDRFPGYLSFPLRPPGETVTIKGRDRKMIPFHMTGVISEASRTFYKIDRLEVKVIPNQRSDFRLPVGTPASLHRVGDKNCQNPEPCTLVDISVGGACVESEFIHEEEEALRIMVRLEDYLPMKFLGQIIRATEMPSGLYQYGILFAQLEETEVAALTKTLYNLQVGNKRNWERSEMGHW